MHYCGISPRGSQAEQPLTGVNARSRAAVTAITAVTGSDGDPLATGEVCAIGETRIRGAARLIVTLVTAVILVTPAGIDSSPGRLS